MKRVLRSCFDPLPRFMSTKSLIGLVAMVVVGTGISVYEYLESSRLPVHAAQSARASEAIGEIRRAPSPRDCEASEPADRRVAPGIDGCADSPTLRLSAEHAADSTTGAQPHAPSVFEPAVENSGS